MPNYNFVCKKCGYKDEVYLSILQRNIKRVCPTCSTQLDRLIGKGSGFCLKGEGFYKQGWQK